MQSSDINSSIDCLDIDEWVAGRNCGP